MGKFKGTQSNEPGNEFETLYINPSFHQDNIIEQSLFIATSEDTVSVASLQYWENKQYRGNDVTHFWFTPEEIDLIVDALIKAKNMIGKDN